MGQAQALLVNMFEQGFLFAFLGLGVLVTFRFFRFPDLTAEGSYPLGGAVVAAMLVSGTNPFIATACAMVAICVAVTKTPVGTTLVVTEIAGLSLLPVTIVAAVVAVVLSARISLIETQRARAVAAGHPA